MFENPKPYLVQWFYFKAGFAIQSNMCKALLVCGKPSLTVEQNRLQKSSGSIGKLCSFKRSGIVPRSSLQQSQQNYHNLLLQKTTRRQRVKSLSKQTLLQKNNELKDKSLSNRLLVSKVPFQRVVFHSNSMATISSFVKGKLPWLKFASKWKVEVKSWQYRVAGKGMM